MIRITSGKFKGKRLEILSKFVRPTSAIKREAFFSIIESYAFKNSYNIYENKIFLDLFAGIGTMGLEAISRGYKYAIFFENNIEVIKSLEKNCKMLCYNLDSLLLRQYIEQSKVDFTKSQTRNKVCKKYHLNNNSVNLILANCNDTFHLTDLIIEDVTCGTCN